MKCRSCGLLWLVRVNKRKDEVREECNVAGWTGERKGRRLKRTYTEDGEGLCVRWMRGM